MADHHTPAPNRSSKVFVATLSTPGGVGKTNVAQCFEAGFTLSGAHPIVVDADLGMRGYSALAGNESCIRLSILDWSGIGVAAVKEAIAAEQPVILDGGANLVAGDRQIGDAVFETVNLATNAGYRVIFLLPVASNKSVSGWAYRELVSRFGPFGNVYIASTDISLSGAYKLDLFTASCPRFDVRVAECGFVAVRMQYVMPLSGFLKLDQAGIRHAQAEMAWMVSGLVEDPLLSDLFSDDCRARLHRIAGERRAKKYLVNTPTQAHDTAIEVNIALYREEAQLIQAAKADPSHPYRRMWDLISKHRQLTRG